MVNCGLISIAFITSILLHYYDHSFKLYLFLLSDGLLSFLFLFRIFLYLQYNTPTNLFLPVTTKLFPSINEEKIKLTNQIGKIFILRCN